MKKEETLLELVDNCPVTVQETTQDDKGEAKLLRVKELREMGFTQLADELEKDMVAVKLKKLADYRYIRISDEMISAFLKRKVERYDREHKPKEKKQSGFERNVADALEEITNDPVEWKEHRQSVIDRMYEIAGIPTQSVESSLVQNPNAASIAPPMSEQRRRHPGEVAPPPTIGAITDIEQLDRLLDNEDENMLVRNGPNTPVSPEENEREEWLRNRGSQIPSGGGGRISQAFAEAEEREDWLRSITSVNMTSRGISSTLSERTCDYMSSEDGKIGQYSWKEEKLEDYKGIPPKEALEALKEHQERQVFDYFTIASVKGIKDPLLLGKINGDEDRFFIAQWGSDVSLDDIL